MRRLACRRLASRPSWPGTLAIPPLPRRPGSRGAPDRPRPRGARLPRGLSLPSPWARSRWGPRRSQKPRGAPPRGLVRTAVLCGPAPPLGRSRARRKTAGGSRARRWAGPWPSAARRAPPRRLSPAPSSRVPASSCRGRPPPLPQGLASPLCRDRWLGVVSRGRLGGSLAHYSQRWPLRTSPSCGVFNNAMSLISLTLQMAPLRGRWPTSPGRPPGRPSCPASAEGPGGAAAGGWCPAGEATDGDVPLGMPCGRVMWVSP